MGNLFTNNQNVINPHFVMLGLDNAGKTTILYKLTKQNDVETICPSIGYYVELLKLKQYSIYSWDIGGSDPRRILYYPHEIPYNGIIFVVDCADKERLTCANEEFQKHLNNGNLKDLPILLLANKKDIAQVNLQDIALEFKLEQYFKNWHIQPCCAVKGDGIQEGLKWLQKQLK